MLQLKVEFNIPQKLSIIIPTHNRISSLMALTKSIENLSESPNEVIIINDGSQDGTGEFLKIWVEDKHDYIALIHQNQQPQGPGAARNIGIKLATSPLVAFTDDDCIIHKSWTRVIKNSKSWTNQENIVGIGGKVLSLRKDIISDYFTFHKILEPPKPISYLVTANACYLKEALIEVHGFNENHKFPGGEDCGLSMKLVNKGYRFEYEPKMVVWHDYRTSLIEFIRTFFRYGKGCAEIVTNHYN